MASSNSNRRTITIYRNGQAYTSTIDTRDGYKPYAEKTAEAQDAGWTPTGDDAQWRSPQQQARWDAYVQQHAGALRAQQIYARKLEQQQLQNAHRQSQYRRQGVIDRSRQMAAERPEQMARWLRMDADAYERKANDTQGSTRYDRFGRDTGYLGEDAGEYAAQQSLAKEYQSRADAARAQSREVSAYGEQYRRQQQEAARAEQIAEDPAAWMRWAQQQSRAARQRWESRGTDGAYNGVTDGIGGGGAQTAADNAAYDEYQRQLKEADDIYRQAYAALREQEAAGQVPTQSSGDAPSAHYRTVNGQSGEPQPRIIGSRAEGNAGTAAITGQRAEAYMSDEQRQTYNYLYATQGKGAAEEYYKLIEPELEQARTQGTQQEFTELSERAPAAMTLLSTLASPTKIAAGLTSVGDALAGDEINTNSAFYTPVHAISAIRQTVPQVTNWTGDKQIFGQDADSYIYGVITSSLDSALNMALATGLGSIAGGAAGLTEEATNSLIANATSALMGAEMLPDTVMEEKAKGRTDEEATAIAIIRSLIEGVTEKYSIEYFLGDPTTFGKKLGKAFLAEGGEEVASNWLNNIVDVVSGDPENVLQQWRDRVDSGENGALAFAEIVGGMLSEDAASFIAGGISGLGMGAVHEGINRAAEDRQASRLGALGQSDAQAVVDEALAINPDSKAAQRAKARLDAGKGVRSVQLGRIMAESDAAILPQEQALAEASQKYGKQAGAMQATYDGEQDVQRYDEAYHVAYEMGRAGTNLKAAQTSMATGYLSEEQRQAAWEAGRDSAGAGSAADIANGRALLGGQIAAVQSISERDGKVYAEILQGAETKRVALEDLKMDAGTRMLAESAKQYGAAAPTIFEQYRKGQQLTQYLRSADMAVSVGMASPSASSKIVLENLKSGQLGRVMAAEQIEALYKAGQQAGKAQLRKTGMTRLGTGSFTLEDSAKGAKLDKRQRASLRFLRDLSRVTGLDISVYKSTSGADGTLMGANGSYVGGRIRIDLNAGAIYEGKLEDASMLRTVSHELTHFMAETAEAEFKELQSFLVEKLSAWEGHSIQDLVDEKLAVAKSHGRDISTEEALEEVVADGCEMMLRDSKAIRQLAEENRTLFEKVRDWMTRFFDALRKAFEGVEAVHPESIHMMENYAEELQNLWDDALTAAVKNAKTANENGTAQVERFSMRTPVEETRDLIAVHNLTEENLESSLNLGGLPSPSIAIIKAEQGHSKYGPISIVFDKSTIDPQADSRNKIYGSDAWTPTVPRVEYQVNSKMLSQIERELHRLAGDTSVAGGIFGNSSALRSMGIDDTSNLNRKQLAEKLASTDTVRAAYLADQGQTLEPVKMDKVWDKFGNDILQKVIDRLGVDTLAEMEANLEVGESAENALGKNAEVIRDILRDYYRKQGEAMLRRMAVKKHWTAAEISEKRQARIDNSISNVSVFTLEDIVRHAWEMYQDGGSTKGEIDRLATSEALRSAVDDHAVEEWIAGKLDGLLGKAGIYNGKDRYTPSGNSRSFAQLHYDYTLENIVRAMNGLQQARGEGIWGASAESFVAVGTPDYRSIDEVRADKGRLREATEEEYDALKAKLDPMIEEIITGVRNSNKAHSDNQFEEIDIIGSLLLDAAKGTKTKAAIRSVFRKNGYTISDALISKAQSLYSEAAKMPTKYFEAKPQRAVSFDEAKAIIVPDNTSAALVQRLEKGGANVVSYKAGDEQARLKALNAQEGVKFSDRDYSYEALTEKPDMEVTEVSGTTLKRRADIIFQAKQNAAKIGTFDPKTGSVSVYVKDIGTDVVIGTNGLKHGLDRRLSENGGVTLKAGEILQNSIRINELTPEHADADAAFVLIGAAKNESGDLYVVRSVVNRFSNEVTSMDVLYAMNAKKENQLRSMRPGFQGPVTGSTISISDLLGYVNEYFPDVLPEGVLRHFGYDARPAGVLGESALFQERDTAATEIATLQRDLRQMQAELKRLKAGDVSDLARVAQYDAKEALKAARQDAKDARAEGVLTGKMEQGRAMAKQISRMEAQKNAQIARLEQRIAETQKRMNDRIAEQRQRLTDYRENRNESDARRHQREQVEKQLAALAKMLTTNNDKLHIPEGLKQPLKELLEAAMPTRYSKRMMSGGTSTKADISLSRTLEKIRKVVTDNEQTGNFGYLDLPPGFLDDISGMTRFVSDKMTEPLHAMNSAQLKELNKTLKALAHSIRQMNQLITAGHFQSVAAASEASVKELKSMSERKLHFGLDSTAGKAEDVLRNFLSWKNTTPYYAFRRFGEGGQDMFRRLADGWDRLAFNSKAIMDFAEDTYTEKEVKAWEKEKHTVTLDSGEVITLSTANAMELYELSKRQQALGHLLGGGVRVANQRSTPAVLTTNDIDTIIGLLTERQREVADKLQEYMELQGSEWGNEVSMKRFGYRYFTEQNYYPVVSDSNELSAKNAAAQENSMYRLLNLSMTKGLQEGANNAIVIGSIFDTFASHMSDMAKYNALALPILDTMKWYNYRLTEKNEAGQLRSRNVKQSVEAVYGADALRYFTTFLEDLNGVSEGGRGEGFANKMISNYKVAAVAANLRVALLQPTAYVRAANVLSPKYLLAAMKNAPKAFWNASGNVFRGSQNGLTGEMLKYSGIALWKSLGFYDTNIGRSVREQIKNAAGIKEKVVEKSMSLAELGDTSTWTVIWSACKMEQKSKGYTGQALLQKTAERFREVVYATQVVDSTMTRSHMMRSKSTFSKLSTAFMSEPTLSYNMLLDAAMGIQMENRRGNNGWKTQSGKLFRAFTVFAATAAASALVESLFDAFRDDDDEDGMTKFIQALFGEKFLDGNLGQNLLPIDSLPYLKDAVSILQGYSNERMDTAFISKIVSVAQIWKETANLANGTLDAPTKVTSFGSMTTWGKIYKTLDALSSTIGLPLAATTREVTSIWNATIGAISPRMKIKRYENKDQKFEWLYSFAQSGSTADYEKELAGLRKVYGIGGKKTEDEITENIQSGMREKIQAHFLDGDISAEEAQKMLDAYTGAETGDAKAYVAKWSCEKDLGVKYDDLKDLYLAGELTDEQAVEYRVKYGLQDEEKAQDTIAKWHYEKETGNATDSAPMAGAYFEYAEPAGIEREMFETAWAFKQNAEGEKDSDGKTISGSVKAQVVEYIQSLGLNRTQAKALWDALKGDWKDEDTPWA